jgi:hypothetical protein
MARTSNPFWSNFAESILRSRLKGIGANLNDWEPTDLAEAKKMVAGS